LYASGVIIVLNKSILAITITYIVAAFRVQKIICLRKGNYYGQFVPYHYFSSKEQYFFVFPSIIERELENEAAVKAKYADGSFRNIKTISVLHVLQIINKIFGLIRDENDKENS